MNTSFSFGELASLIFDINFVILFFTSTNNLSKHSKIIQIILYSCSFSKQTSERKIYTEYLTDHTFCFSFFPFTINKQIFHAFMFNIRNYSPEVINIHHITEGE